MDSAVVVLFCATLVAITYLIVEGVRTTHLVNMALGEAAPSVLWAVSADLILAVTVATIVAMKGYVSIPMPVWAEWTLVVIGWWLMLSGVVLAWLVARYNMDEYRDAQRSYTMFIESCA